MTSAQSTVATTVVAGALVGLVLFPLGTGQIERAFTGLLLGSLVGVLLGILIVRWG